MNFKEMSKLFYYYSKTVSSILDLESDICDLFEIYSEINGSKEYLLSFDEWLIDNDLVDDYSLFVERLGF